MNMSQDFKSVHGATEHQFEEMISKFDLQNYTIKKDNSSTNKFTVRTHCTP